MPNSEFTDASPYGQACMDCSKSKCKCMRRPTGGSCERCIRRGFDCRRATAGRHKSSKGLGSRTTQLEAKLDTLVTLLQSSSSANAPLDITKFRGLETSGIGISSPGNAPAGGVVDHGDRIEDLVCLPFLSIQSPQPHRAQIFSD